MKVFATIFAFVVLLQTSVNTTKTVQKENRTITVTVPNVTSDSGKVHYALYNKVDFMKKPIQSQSSIVKEGKSTVIFTNLEPGNYAVICFHDANSNGTMDFESNGMPIENYGVSNNPMSFGPPNFDEAQFEVSDKDVTLEIKF